MIQKPVNFVSNNRLSFTITTAKSNTKPIIIPLIILANERVLIDFKQNGERPGFVPDGMTIDADGNLYVATWGGSRIIKVNAQ